MEFEQAGDGSGFLLCLGILMAVCIAEKRASVTVDVDGSPPLSALSRKLSQQSSHDADPFRIQWLPANRLASPAIPIRCVALVALFAMEVRMHPRTVTPFILLGGLVCPLPIAFGVKPQSGKRLRESGWRLSRGERFTKIVQGHLSI